MSDRGSIDPSSWVTVSPQQISSVLGGEIVIMDLKKGVYHGMDGVAVFIWNLLGDPISIQEICHRVMAEYDVDAPRCEADVLALIQQLLDEGLVTLVDPSPAKVSRS